MFLKVWFVTATLTIVSTTSSSNVVPLVQCPGESFEGLENRIQVEPCTKPQGKFCKLQRNTNVTVTLRFKTEKVVKSLTNSVHADIGGIDVPFIGVDGTDACQHVKRAEADEYVSCPLAAGQEYVYTNMFSILSLYPKIHTIVHWALNDGNNNLICFEVPAAITDAPKKHKN